MANSADPDQLASSEADLDLHCLQMQGISRFSRTRDLLIITKFYYLNVKEDYLMIIC